MHTSPGLGEDNVKEALDHLSATKLSAVKDLFIMSCKIEGAFLVVSPHVVPSSSEKDSKVERICADYVLHSVHGVDHRALSPLLLYANTEAARQQE